MIDLDHLTLAIAILGGITAMAIVGHDWLRRRRKAGGAS